MSFLGSARLASATVTLALAVTFLAPGSTAADTSDQSLTPEEIVTALISTCPSINPIPGGDPLAGLEEYMECALPLIVLRFLVSL